MAKVMRCFPAPAGFDPASPPDRIKIDPDDVWEIEEGEGIVVMCPRPESRKYVAITAAFHSEDAGFYRGTCDPKWIYWAVINGN